MTDGAGAVVERTTYRPYGEEVRLSQPLTLAETKGFIGERFDDGAGLQYLNARYYDPRLAMFVQPDWWEVTSPGVGTNRYSYSFNDPVNGRDPGGNGDWSDLGRAIRDFFRGFASGAASSASLDNTAAGLVGGAAIGATYGGSAGVGAGCAVSGCATSPVLGGGGFVSGGLAGGALGGSAGLVKDFANMIGGGLRGGVEAVRNGSIVANEQNPEADETADDPPPADGQRKSKTPNSGEPGSVHVNPGSGQIREYGDDGLPKKDIDSKHDHGQGTPHVHDWTRTPDGRPHREPGRPYDPERDGDLF